MRGPGSDIMSLQKRLKMSNFYFVLNDNEIYRRKLSK